MHHKRRQLFSGRILFLVMGCIIIVGASSSSALTEKAIALVNPPIGTEWGSDAVSTWGETTTGTWTIRLEAFSKTFVSMKLSYKGDIGIRMEQPCGTSFPFPSASRLAMIVSASFVSDGSGFTPLFTSSQAAESYLGFKAGQFQSCEALSPSIPAQPSLITYVRFTNFEFSVVNSDIPLSSFAMGQTIQGNGVIFNGSSTGPVGYLGRMNIAVPQLEFVSTTTTTFKRETTTRSPASNINEDESATTTIPEQLPVDSQTTTDTIIRNAVLDDQLTDVGASNPLLTETVSQSDQRRKDASASLSVTLAAVASLISFAAPAVGAAGAAGVAGGVIGVTGSRALLRRDLYAHVPQKASELPDSRRPNDEPAPSDVADGRTRGAEFYNDTGEKLENDFQAPRRMSKEDGGATGIELANVGRLFTYEIRVLQQISRARLFRVGLRRVAEIALFSPVIVLLLPIALLMTSVIVGRSTSNGMSSSVIYVMILFIISFAAPVLCSIAVLGWAIGRLANPTSDVFLVLAECIALLPGLLIIPMMLRGLIGPSGKSSRKESTLAFVAAPVVGVLAFRSWLTHLPDVAGTVMKALDRIPGVDTRTPVFVTPTAQSAILFSTAMAVLVLIISILAVRFSNNRGEPIVMFRRFINLNNPVQALRREYVEHTTVEIGNPSRWTQLALYVFALSVLTYSLFEILGWSAVVLSSSFLFGVFLLTRTTRLSIGETRHPVVKTVPMTAIGLLLGAITVSSGQALMAFIGLAIFSLVALFVQPRPLWE